MGITNIRNAIRTLFVLVSLLVGYWIGTPTFISVIFVFVIGALVMLAYYGFEPYTERTLRNGKD